MPSTRPALAGPDAPVTPFPLHLQGPVVHGYKRGSKQLGFPTANLPQHVVDALCSETRIGIYYGWAQVIPPTDEHTSLVPVDAHVHPMVMSLGYNPFYHNVKRSAEVYIIHHYDGDFYGAELRVLVCGYLREERDYTGVEALIADIREDVEIGVRSLQRPAYAALRSHPLFAPAPETQHEKGVENGDART